MARSNSNGELYLANRYGTTTGTGDIVAYNSSGQSSLFANVGVRYPQGIAFDASGTLYVCNAGYNNIEAFDSTGHGSVFASAGLSYPLGIAIAPVPEPSIPG
jgi:DNA-binding beta-propeller fold protein YncE